MWESFKKQDGKNKDKKAYEKKFIVDLLDDFISVLDSISEPGKNIYSNW